ARFGKPLGAGHLGAVGEHRAALLRRDDAAPVPQVGPEFLGALHRPAVEVRVGIELELALADYLARKLRELRLLDGALGRLPEQLGRSHGDQSTRAPEAFTTGAHFAISALTKPENSSGVIGM